MSMPNIPNITPEIDISFKDSVNLLLTSIAMEEISLSKIMDEEANKIKTVLCGFKNCKANAQDVIDINESANRTIKSLIKMQMLLQFKLEDVKSLIPTTTKTTTCCKCSRRCRFCKCCKCCGCCNCKRCSTVKRRLFF